MKAAFETSGRAGEDDFGHRISTKGRLMRPAADMASGRLFFESASSLTCCDERS